MSTAVRTPHPLLRIFSRDSWENLSRDKSDTLLLLAACLLVMLPHTDHLSIWTSIQAGLILLWRAYVTFAGKRMPSRWLLLPVALLSIVGVYLGQKSFFGRESGVAMLVLLLALKMLEMHAKRDLFVVTFLALFLILTNFLYSQTILTACMMVLALLTILTAQMSFQYTGKVPSLLARMRQIGTMMLMAVPLTLVLFLLFPRIQGPLWGLPNDANARSGLSSSMTPGNVSNLALSEEVAFKVRFYDPPPPPSQRYWRGPVLGLYDGRTWTEMNWAGVPLLRLPPIQVQAKSPTIRYQVTQESSNQRWLFALDLPRNMPAIDDQIASLSRDFQLRLLSPITKRIRYDLGSVTDFAVEVDGDPRLLQRWLLLPGRFNPRTRQFARQLEEKYADPQQQINAVLQYFRRENFSYTLQPPLLGRHAVDEFLFVTRAGFCEHYASSFVILMRMLGIPSRVVTGYQGGEINPVDGVMTIRQSDAHAWAEVWLENRGWIRIDPTAAVAPERIAQNLAGALPKPETIFGTVTNLNAFVGRGTLIGMLRDNLQAINNAWSQWVLDYTPERQKSFLASLGLEDINWRSMILLSMLLGGIAMAAILIPMIRSQQKRDPLDKLYFALHKIFDQRGLGRMPHEGPSSWGARLDMALQNEAPQKRAALARFLQLYTQQKFGKPESVRQTGNTAPNPALITTLQSLLKQIR